MTLDDAKVILRAAAEFVARQQAQRPGTPQAHASEVAAALMVLDALDAAEARAAAAEAGQRAYGEVLLALSSNGPRPADPGWGPVAQALYGASVGGIGTGGTEAAVGRAMDAAAAELAKEKP